MDYYVKNDLSLILDSRWTSQGDGTISGKRGRKVEVYQEADFTLIADGSGVQSDYKLIDGVITFKSQEERNAENALIDYENTKKEAEQVYLDARADTTVVWNDVHTLRWHKARHWEDWHRMLSISDGGGWYTEEGVLLNLTNSNVKQISKLVEINHRAAFDVYWAAVNN
jgi:hypothetical protein